MPNPRIVLDARPLSHPQRGGFRSYVRSLVVGLAERGTDDIELLLYLDRPLPPEEAALLPPNVQTRILSPDRLKTDWLLFPRQVRVDAPDLVHGTANYLPLLRRVPTTLNIHDALGVKTYPWDKRTVRWTPRDRLMNRYWYFMTRAAARRASRIVTGARGAAQEVAKALGLPLSRFSVVDYGVALPEPAAGIPRRSNVVLMFHSPDNRKNAECIYQAFGAYRSRLGTEAPCLEIICASEKTATRAQECCAAQGITQSRLLRGLDDAALADAYAAASVFVWPSRWEGFGLPPVEAMRCGCPVISSNAPVMPEILGDAPVFFDPDNPEELANRLGELLRDPIEQERRSALGRVVAARYTCRNMAEAMVALWQDVVETGWGTA